MTQQPSDNPAAAAPAGGPLSEARRRLVLDCRAVVANTLPKLLSGLFERLDDALFAQGDKGGAAPMTTMRELRLLHKPIEGRLLDAILRRFDALWAAAGVEPPSERRAAVSEDSLSLVDESDLEESLAITNMVTKGENRYYRDLFAIAKRFEHLLGRPEGSLDEKGLPIAPAVLAQQFREAAQGLPGDINTRLFIFKMFENEVMNYLGGMYDEINALLVGQGILPKLPHKLHTHPVSPSVRRARGEEIPEEEANKGRHGEGGGEAEGARVLEGLRELVRWRREAVGGAEEAETLPAVDAAALMRALSQLQQAAPAPDQAAGELVKGELLRQFQIGHGAGARNSIGRSEEDIIDIISMLFDFILEDRALADSMKALIGRLQIPLLKVAILDRNFFSKKTHPARRLLNVLAQAAVGWSDDGDRSPNSLYGRVETVVNRVLTEFTDDITLFGVLHDDFTNWHEQEHKKAESTEARATQASEGKERLALARLRVRENLDRRLSSHGKVPKVVQQVLEEAWSDVLRITFLRHGPESPEWRQGLEVVDRLLWSVETKHDNKQRKELLAAIPNLLKELREGLLGISYDQHKMTKLFKDLRNAHIACLRNEDMGEMVEPPTRPRPEAAPTPSAAEAAVPAGETAPPADPILHQVEQLTVGRWVEFRRPDELPQRNKLAWRSRVSDMMVFVDRRGLKTAEMRVGELADAIRADAAVILENVEKTLMERALDAMKGALQRSKEEAAAAHHEG